MSAKQAKLKDQANALGGRFCRTAKVAVGFGSDSTPPGDFGLAIA